MKHTTLQQLWGVLLLLCLGQFAYAQDQGKIVGKVTDKKTGEALIGVTVVIQNAGQGAVTDVEGRYTLGITPGTYILDFKYMGYQTKSISDVVVKAGAPSQLDIIMDEPKSKELKEVVIKGSFKQETINALYSAQKNNAVVSDGISADLIKKSPDRSTGEVLKRVSGTSIQDNRFVVVRGLGERYNTTLMNNSVLPSTEPDKKAFSFDIIPSNLIDNITIYKTASPDLPGDFAGGAVKVSTKDFPAERFTEITLGTGYNTQTTFKNFVTGPPKGNRDFLGFDDGSRKLPSSFPKNGYTDLTVDQKKAIAKTFPNTFGVTQENTSLPPLSLQVSTGNSFATKGNNKFGYIFSVNYGLNRRRLTRERNEYDLENTNYLYNNEVYNKTYNLGSVLNLAYTFGKNKIAWKNFYNNDFNIAFTRRSGVQLESGSNDVFSYNNETTQNGLFNSVLEGQHVLKSDKLTIDWNLSYGYSYRNQPDQRIQSFTRETGSGLPFHVVLSTENSPAIRDAGRVYSKLHENIFGGNLNFSVPFKLFDQSQKLKFGGTKVYRDRDFSALALGYAGTAFRTQIDLDKGITPENIYSAENLDKYNLFLARIDLNTKDYKGTSDLTAGFIMLDNKFTENLRLVWGARIESYNQTLKAVNENKQKYDNVDVLPSANLTYAVSPKTNLRASYSKAVNRPEFRELASFSFYDYENDFNIFGAPGLKRATNDNADLRVEYFPGVGEILSASVFYKKFKDPIEMVNRGNNNLSYANATSATDYGAEIELRKKLDFISKTKFLQALTFYVNAAWIDSKVTLAGTSKKTPLQGQSPYLINGGLSYSTENNDLSLNLLYNRIGQRLRFRGTDEGLDTYEKPRDLIDFQISKKILRQAGELKLNVSDILAQPIAWYYKFPGGGKSTAYDAGKDKIISSMKPGTTFSITFKYNFATNSGKR